MLPCPRVLACLLLVAFADAQLLAPLMSLASNLNPFQGITSGLTGGLGGGLTGGLGSGLRGGLLSSLRGAASNNVGFSAMPGGRLVPPPVAAPAMPPFPGFGNHDANISSLFQQLSLLLSALYDALSLLFIFSQANLIPALEQ